MSTSTSRVSEVLSSSASEDESDTCSLDSSFERTVTIHGREFQEYSIENGIYYVPVDEDEADRLNRQHEVLKKLFDDKLIFPPVEDPKKILDCGYGSGAWAIEVAEMYPESEVIGIDISPHLKPTETPSNLWCQVDDLNEQFSFRTNEFDFIQSRLIAPGLDKERWNTYVEDCFRVLKPGGWLQMVEIYYNIQSDNGTLTDEHSLRQWSNKYLQALEESKDLRAPIRMKSMLEEAGFTETESLMMMLPLNGWPICVLSNLTLVKRLWGRKRVEDLTAKLASDRDHEIGVMNAPNAKRVLGTLALYPFTDKLDMPIADVHVLVAHARNELDNISLKPYFPLYVVIGRKPDRD